MYFHVQGFCPILIRESSGTPSPVLKRAPRGLQGVPRDGFTVDFPFVIYCRCTYQGHHLLFSLLMSVPHLGHVSTEITLTGVTLVTWHQCFAELQRMQMKVCNPHPPKKQQQQQQQKNNEKQWHNIMRTFLETKQGK